MHCNVTVVTTNLACWGWEIWNELKTNTSLQFIIEAFRKLEQKATSNSSTQDLQAMWPIQELIQMRGRANLPKKCSFQPLFTDLRPIQSFTPAPEGSRQPSHSLVFISISHLSYHISKGVWCSSFKSSLAGWTWWVKWSADWRWTQCLVVQ